MRVPRLVLIAALSLAAIRCGTQSSAAPSQNTRNAAPEVTVARVEQAPLTRTVTVNGTLAAEEQVMLSLKVTGRIDELCVDLGSRVQKGEVIARLTPTDFDASRAAGPEAALQQARARLGLPLEGEGEAVDLEQTALVRQARPRSTKRACSAIESRRSCRGIAAKAELDTANANLQIADGHIRRRARGSAEPSGRARAAQSELALASQQLETPFCARRSTAWSASGLRWRASSVPAGTPVVTVVRQDPLRLQLAVPERSAGRFGPGQLVRVTVEGTTELHRGPRGAPEPVNR